MLSISNAGWFATAHGHGTAMMLPLSLILVVIGILAFTNERALDAVIFFGGAGLFWSGHEYLLSLGTASGASADPAHYAGWYWFVWAVFYFYVWLGSFKAGLFRMLFLLGLWLTLLALAIGEWAGLHAITKVGGYLGLITAVLAAIVSALAVVGHGSALGSGTPRATSPAA
jgi:succinate-acetate transporter protein